MADQSEEFHKALARPVAAMRRPAAWVLLIAILLMQPSKDAHAVTVINNSMSNSVLLGTDISSLESNLFIQNAGCDARLEDPCLAPGAATSVTILFGAASLLRVDVRETSNLTIDFGELSSVSTFESSTATITDGTLSLLSAFDDSAVELAGTIGVVNVSVQDQATFTLTGGAAFPLSATGSAAIFLDGGTASQVTVADDARLEMTNAVIQNSLRFSENSSALITGGVVAVTISISDTAHIRLEGGSGLVVVGTSQVELIGSSFAVDGAPVGFGPLAATGGTLTGVFADGTAFSAAFGRVPTATIQLPEPRGECAALLTIVFLFLAGTLRSTDRSRMSNSASAKAI